MKKKDQKITLIVPIEAEANFELPEEGDIPRGSQSRSQSNIPPMINYPEHYYVRPTGFRGWIPNPIKWFESKKEVDFEDVKDNLTKCLNQVNEIINGVSQDVVEGWELDNISVSLSVSAEGSVGIATAGVEANFEVTFSRKRPTN